MYIPKKFKNIIDVTKAPYYCDNTGKKDCTESLQKAFNDILSEELLGMQKAVDKLNASDDPNFQISFEIKKHNNVLNVIFPEDVPDTKILYFPKGTYLVSDTISHNLEDLRNLLMGQPTMEISRKIYIRGEDRDQTVIKLKDNCKGYEFGNEKAILSYYRMDKSNISHLNTCSDITIDCGKGNPGAVGLKFSSSNSGSVRNVVVKSSDENLRGAYGILSDRATEAYFKDITVIGYDYGIKLCNCHAPNVLENITFKNQNFGGFIGHTVNVALRNITTEGVKTPITLDGYNSQAAIVDCKLLGGMAPKLTAIRIFNGECYMRNITTEGYDWPYTIGYFCDYFDPYIDEISTCEEKFKLFDNDKLSLNLSVEDAPSDFEPISSEDVAYVDDFGAVGDGVTECSDAIQKALDSGKPAVYFGVGHYFVNKPVIVPESVKLIDFMYCDFYSGSELENSTNKGFMVVTGDKENLTLRNVLGWEKFYGYFRFIEHAGRRTLILRDIHLQAAGVYFNTVEGGKVFIENVACTTGNEKFGEVTPFAFKGQKVWCRNINPERGKVQILNDNSKLWVFGMKTESHVGAGATTAIKTINGGETEGYALYSGIGGDNLPLYINDNSSVSLYFIMGSTSPNSMWKTLVYETQNGESKELMDTDAQRTGKCARRVQGYVGIKNN